MKKTIGSTDKVIRIVIGIVLLVIAFAAPTGPVLKTILIILGIIALVTAVTGLCPLYSALGISTNKPKDKEA